MKSEAVQRWEYQPPKPYSSTNPLHGSAIGIHTLPPDRLNLRYLSAISANLGTIFAGTATFGDPAGACLRIGDDEGGMTGYDSQHRKVWSWNSQQAKLTIGRGDQGQDMFYTSETRLYIHGDAVITGTLSVDKLSIGTLGRIFMEEDMIRIGTGWPSTFTGFLVNMQEIGGYDEGSGVWTVDMDTGKIVTYGNDEGYEWVTLGNGQMVFSGYGDRDPFRFQLWLRLDEGNILLKDVGMDVDSDGIIFYDATGTAYPVGLRLEGAKGTVFSELRAGEWGSHSPNQQHYFSMSATDSGYGEISLAPGGDYGVIRAAMSRGFEFSATHISPLRAPLCLWPTYAGDRVTTRPTAQKGMVWYNGDDDRIEYSDGTNWYYLEGILIE